jgi:hypothetical protein
MGHYVLLLLQLFVVVATDIRIEQLWNFKLHTCNYGYQRQPIYWPLITRKRPKTKEQDIGEKEWKFQNLK